MSENGGSEFESNFIEKKRLERLVEKYEAELGQMNIIPVGTSGYIVERKSALPMAGNDWIMFDYDDTLVATSEIKGKRQELFTGYLEQKLGHPVSSELAREIMEKTDEFSRWEDQEGAGEQYHANAHMSALSFVVDTLIEVHQTEPEELEKSTKETFSTLDRIKGQLEHISKPLQTNKG